MRALDFTDRPSLYGVGASREVEQQHSEAVDVAARSGWLTLEYFRRQIHGRARQRNLRPVVVELQAGSEVSEHYATGCVAHHVLGLHVPMQESGAMNCAQGATEFDADTGHLGGFECAAVTQLRFERTAIDELHP